MVISMSLARLRTETNLDIERLTSHSELGIDEIWRTSQILATVFLQQHPLQVTTTIGDPHMTTLLLVKVINHNLMLYFIDHG